LGHAATTVLEASFGFDAGFLVGMGLLSTLLLGQKSILCWIPVFPFFFCLDTVVNLYATLSLKRGLNAVWDPPERAKEKNIT
jgi:hypothetical protein